MGIGVCLVSDKASWETLYVAGQALLKKGIFGPSSSAGLIIQFFSLQWRVVMYWLHSTVLIVTTLNQITQPFLAFFRGIFSYLKNFQFNDPLHRWWSQ